MYKLGFIGYGLRARTMLAALEGIGADITVAAVADPAWRQIQTANGPRGFFENTRYYAVAGDMLEKETLDGVLLCTRCGQHAPLAAQVLKAGLPLFLEKPVCIDEDGYRLLAQAARGRENQALVSFPLRLTPLVQRVRRMVEEGRLGRITMVQAVNNVPYGRVYYASWYRDEALTGGLFLQKATHDIDLLRCLTGEEPANVFAKESKLYYGGSRPAGLRCPACPEYHSCPESSHVVKHLRKEPADGDGCCFAADTGNHDHASMVLQTPAGVLLSYNQSFVVKKGAGRRGARLIGTEGALEFDFYTGEIRLDSYGVEETTRVVVTPPAAQHFGGDEALALAWMELLAGGPSRATLEDGLRSAAICLAARRSAAEGLPVDIRY